MYVECATIRPLVPLLQKCKFYVPLKASESRYRGRTLKGTWIWLGLFIFTAGPKRWAGRIEGGGGPPLFSLAGEAVEDTLTPGLLGH